MREQHFNLNLRALSPDSLLVNPAQGLYLGCAVFDAPALTREVQKLTKLLVEFRKTGASGSQRSDSCE